ncbi:hypothetical protein [Pedobacter sp. Leaf250]|uniref:hypothetical protein n=1 Tax=Pedobacter sp. Leaf250 TaxID=2876559 RepID=UPI001E624BBB|nr:hypothetical protein [Pedobacter sp. Leaf250]
MKYTILFLVFISSLMACRKGEDSEGNEIINGKWSTGGYDIILYDASGAVVRHTVADAIKSYWAFDNLQIKFSNDINADVQTSDYKVMNMLGAKTLFIENKDITSFQNWTIAEQTSNYMIISAIIKDKTQLTYGQNQVAAKGLKTIYLSKVL